MSTANPVVAALQMRTGADVAENLAQARGLLEDAARAKAVLAVLPENFAFMGAKETDKLSVAEPQGEGAIQSFLATQARRLGLWIVGGTLPMAVPERKDKVWAASLMYSPEGKLAAHYDKVHLFDVEVAREDGVDRYRESATIEQGDIRFVTQDTPAGRVGMTVCYDLRYPELYRRLSRDLAEIIVVPSAFTQRTGEAHWEPLLRARAIENQCFIIAPNQHGQHPGGRKTYGHSCIIDPWGTVIAERAEGVGIVTATLRREQLFNLRRTFPVLTHRRIVYDRT
ncbi:carbon-nitrogen hydrolase family protein [Algiphilus sp. W345]|uniref:Carbon-nitrogen hydrolase family protein n=1 Tax=Banduia mediterranea TaxID=3075609 RepID=A0ABU2WIP9_9GAMM|nr:carbon-nitrogen hydrolase family protein [Algiphilus sp. W345]MDT0496962.1 carbon-nitrogen hydrolase family protein [Algiphilus sp. W345]